MGPCWLYYNMFGKNMLLHNFGEFSLENMFNKIMLIKCTLPKYLMISLLENFIYVLNVLKIQRQRPVTCSTIVDKFSCTFPRI